MAELPFVSAVVLLCLSDISQETSLLGLIGLGRLPLDRLEVPIGTGQANSALYPASRASENSRMTNSMDSEPPQDRMPGHLRRPKQDGFCFLTGGAEPPRWRWDTSAKVSIQVG